VILDTYVIGFLVSAMGLATTMWVVLLIFVPFIGPTSRYPQVPIAIFIFACLFLGIFPTFLFAGIAGAIFSGVNWGHAGEALYIPYAVHCFWLGPLMFSYGVKKFNSRKTKILQETERNEA